MNLLTIIFHALMCITILLGLIWIIAAAFAWMPPMVAIILLAILAWCAFGEVLTAKKEINDERD